ncbi:hypothetical protein D3C76_1368210 [compost metagenome]
MLINKSAFKALAKSVLAFRELSTSFDTGLSHNCLVSSTLYPLASKLALSFTATCIFNTVSSYLTPLCVATAP